MFTRFKTMAGAAAVSICLTGSAFATSISDAYSSFWVMGDSLSDNGNLSYLVYGFGTGWNYLNETGTNAYYEGRFSNGPTWAEYVADEFEAAGLATGNLAHADGEALEPNSWFDVTPGLAYQKEELAKKAGQFGAKPLVSILMGANDLMEAMGAANILDVAVDAANAVTNAARELVSSGVTDFLIGNLPDLSSTPRYAMFTPAAASTARAATEAFNAQLASNINGMRTDGLNVTTLDLWTILGQLAASPADYGLTDATRPCLYPNAAAAAAYGEAEKCSNEQSLTRLFFDSVHPSTRVHEAVGNAVIAALTPAPVPLPASLPLLMAGVAGLGWLRRKRSRVAF